MAPTLTADELRLAGFVLAQTFDSEKQNLGSYVLTARVVLEAALASAAAADDPEQATAYWRVAFHTAYNVAAATWPGWGPETKVGTDHQRIGADLAHLHRSLLDKVDLPAQRHANAHWIVAAHQLAAGNRAQAQAGFQQAMEIARSADVEETALMAEGWLHLVNVLAGSTEALEALIAIKSLEAQGDDGRFYAAQYDPAIAVFGADGR